MRTAMRAVALVLFLGVGGAWVYWVGWGGPVEPEVDVVMPSSKAATGAPDVAEEEVLLPSSKAWAPTPVPEEEPLLFPSSKAGLPIDDLELDPDGLGLRGVGRGQPVLMPSSKAAAFRERPTGEVEVVDEDVEVESP